MMARRRGERAGKTREAWKPLMTRKLVKQNGRKTTPKTARAHLTI